MALSANTVFEVRTTGSDSNGGGFVTGASGSDFSQQNAAGFALTGIATAGIGATFLTTSAASSMVGNILQVISGTNFTTGFFQITSISAGVSVTVDRNICTGIGASGVINIGGALATIGAATAVMVTSNTIWVKASAGYTITSNFSYPSLGGQQPGSSRYSTIVGYSATRGDTGKASLTLSSSATVGFVTGASGCWIENFDIDCASIASSIGISLGTTAGTGGVSKNCKVRDYKSTGISAAVVDSCEITGGASGAVAVVTGALCRSCNIHDNVCSAISLINGVAYRNIITNNTGASSDGISPSGGSTITMDSNTIHGCGRDGIRSGGDGTFILRNNIITSSGGYGWNQGSEVSTTLMDGNAYYNNTSGARSSTASGPGDITLTGDPYVNAASGDFSLNNTAGAGSACRAAGFPGIFPGGLTTGYLDVGAVQHQDTGGGGGLIVAPNMVGVPE